MKRLVTTLVALTVSLSGCALFFVPGTDLLSIRVISQPQANRNTATALDVVLVYRKDLLPQLPDNAPDWFQQRNALIGKYQPQLEVISLELPPGDLIEELQLSQRQMQARGVVLYANYLAPQAQYPINVTGFEFLEVTLEPETITTNELGLTGLLK